MEKFIINGGKKLKGSVSISGSKNAALPILAATILAEGESVIKGVPDLRDVRTICKILNELGVKTDRQPNGDITAKVISEKNSAARYDLVKTMRASICVLGPLLAKRGQARISLPGGCVIGVRPIDLHEKGLRQMAADIRYEHGNMIAQTKKLSGGLAL